MLLAYVDESSRTSVTNGEKIYAMGALVVNESQTRAIENGFDNICSIALEEIEKILTPAHLGRDLALVLADEHHTAPDSRTRFKSLRQHAASGQTSIPLNHLMDTIYFGPSNHSRILQAVDVATFFKLKYNHSTESHPAAKKSMIKIKQNINKVCCFDYIWP